MSLKEGYIQSIDKLDYFQNLSSEEKRNLYNELEIIDRKNFLKILPIQDIKDFINLYSKEERQHIYEKLSDTQLREIYGLLTKEEKETVIEVLEERQINLNKEVESARKKIQDSTSTINVANDSIEQSNINIVQNKENIKMKRVELRNQRVILKKLERDRKRKLKKVLAAKKKLSSPLNRIGIISKYRTNKYLDRLNELEQINQVIDTNKMETIQIHQDINDLNGIIEREIQNINEQNQIKKGVYKEINLNVEKIKTTESQIKKLSNVEKKMLGRKLYKKTVLKRDCIIVRNKSIMNKRNQGIEGGRVKESDGNVVEVTDTEGKVNNIVNNANNLQDMGVIFIRLLIELEVFKDRNYFQILLLNLVKNN